MKAENIFHLKYDINRITKLIYKYEIYKRILKAAGEILSLDTLITNIMSIAIIQARSNSRRFPNKVLKLINGKPLISYVYNRVKKAKEVKIYVACSNLKSDDILAKYCKDKKYNLYRGS